MRIVPAGAGRLLCIAVWGCAAVASSFGQAPSPSSASRTALIEANSCTKECHQDVVSHKVMHKVSLTKCDACHIQGNPKQHRFHLIVPKEELCLRCHAVPHEGTTHTPVRQGRCMECHDPHGSEQPRSLRADPKRELCVKCHTQDFSQFKFVHGPVAVGACIVCHKPHSSTEPALLVKDARSLCLTCHGEIQTKGEQQGHMHGALQQGCIPCHNPHASDLKYQLRAEAPDLCMKCHKEHFDQVTSAARVVHGAIHEKGGCTGCHEPHSSRLASLQRGSQPGICLDCHSRPLTTQDGKPLTDMAAFLAENPDHHGPIRDGNCTACHETHTSRNFRLLKEEYPAAFYAPFELATFKLCFKCHIPDLVLSKSGTGLTQFRDGDRNLHFLHVNQAKGRTCRSCHEVHASKRPAHIRESVPFGSGEWMLPLNYQKSPEGGSCMPGCHESRHYDRTSVKAEPSPEPLFGPPAPPPTLPPAPLHDQSSKGP
jgi:predicted CXXCH cytochrome family protein